MAFNFIKKVFSFGSKQVEEVKDSAQPAEIPAQPSPAEIPSPTPQEVPLTPTPAETPQPVPSEVPAPQPEIPSEPSREVPATPAPKPQPPEIPPQPAEPETPRPEPSPPPQPPDVPAQPEPIAPPSQPEIPQPAPETTAGSVFSEGPVAKPGGVKKMFDRLLGKQDYEIQPTVEAPSPVVAEAPVLDRPPASEILPPIRELEPAPTTALRDETAPEPSVVPAPPPPEAEAEQPAVQIPHDPEVVPADEIADAPPAAEILPPIRQPEPAPTTPLHDEIAPEPVNSPEPPKPAPGKVTVAKSVEKKTEPVVAAPAPRLTWFQRMREGLSRSSRELSANITGIFTKRKLDDDTLQDLEDVLIRADLGVETALRITDTLASTRLGRDVSDAEVRGVMATEIEKVLKVVALPLELDLSHRPHVILVVGVNGTGKTTTIGKLAAKLHQGGLSVTLAAGDTFRAAAIEQLKIWGERTGSPVISSKLGADAAGLAYDAFEQAKAAGSDVLIIDTAGRLQNRTELMAELEKIVRVLGKLDPEAPHTVLQTVDATTGQNALNQVEIFRNIAGVNGLVMTKLDGTARGGILVAIAAKHRLPVYFIGVGEQVDDLEPFSANEFARAIAGVA